MPNQCYFEGEFYQCVTATTAGESPATAPTKWRRIRVPKEWRWVLSRLAYAHLLEMDGQKDKAQAERAQAVGAERQGLEYLIRREARSEFQTERPDVQSRD